MLPYLDLHIKYARRGFTFFLDVMLIEYKVEKRKKEKLKKGKVRTEAGVGYFIMCHIFLWSKINESNENL